jgi:23S rRNA pseudouridine1911/1915/1917 synthase
MRKKLHERIQVLYEDLDLIVIEKAEGIISYPVEGSRDESAIQLIRRYWKVQGNTNKNLYLLHRLDKDTSGLLVFAKTSLARESLLKQFEEHTVVRQYLAVTQGIPRKPKGEIHTKIGHDFRGRRAVSQYGKEAITAYEVSARNPALERALVACRLKTGRTHQVRIHLAYIGAPVIGDAVYSKEHQQGRLALHAQMLGFMHPRTGLPIVFRIPLPESLKRLL